MSCLNRIRLYFEKYVSWNRLSETKILSYAIEIVCEQLGTDVNLGNKDFVFTTYMCCDVMYNIEQCTVVTRPGMAI